MLLPSRRTEKVAEEVAEAAEEVAEAGEAKAVEAAREIAPMVVLTFPT